MSENLNIVTQTTIDNLAAEVKDRFAPKATGAAEGNLASFDGSGNPVDGGVKVRDLLTDASVKDYTREEIAAMFADE